MSTRLRNIAWVNPPTAGLDALSPGTDVAFMPLEAVWSGNGADVSRTRPVEEVASGYVRFMEGDVLCPKVTPTFQAGRSMVVPTIPGQVGAATTEVHVVRPKPGLADPRFLMYRLLTKDFLEEGVSRFQGVAGLQRVPADFIMDLPVVDLPVEEQRRIAEFLDDQVARIDEALESREKQVSLIDEAFDAKVKDLVLGTGSQSLGWADGIGDDRELLPLGRLMTLRGEKNDPVTVTQILSLTAKRGVIPYEEKGDIGNKASEDISRYSIVRPRDIVVNSMNVIIGSVGLSQYEGVLSPVYYVMRPVSNLRALPEFVALHFRIREFQQQLVKLGYGILEHRMRIPWINLKAEKLAVPALPEQERIVQALEPLDSSRKLSLATVDAGIALLEERRRALITAAVTGQLDVTTARPIRTWASK